MSTGAGPAPTRGPSRPGRRWCIAVAALLVGLATGCGDGGADVAGEQPTATSSSPSTSPSPTATQGSTGTAGSGTGEGEPAPDCAGWTAPRPDVGPGQMLVSVWFTCDPRGAGTPSPFEVHRTAQESPAVLRAAVTALLAGPTAEEREAGLRSWFSTETAGLLRGVSLADGHAVVDLGDLRQVVPNASTSAGSAVLLSELDATVLQFPTVRTAEYRIEGSCTAFTEWLQIGGCAPRAR